MDEGYSGGFPPNNKVFRFRVLMDKNVTRRKVQKTLTGTGTSTRAHKLEKINNLFTFFLTGSKEW